MVSCFVCTRPCDTKCDTQVDVALSSFTGLSVNSTSLVPTRNLGPSAGSLSSEALTPVIGLVATASMAIISMLSGITGSQDKEERPEFQVIQQLIQQSKEPMTVTIEGDKVTVTKGNDKITTGK